MLVDTSLFEWSSISLRLAAVSAAIVSAATYAVIRYRKDRPLSGFPLVALDGKTPTESWLFHGNETIEEGLRRFPGAFQVMTGTGPKILLPNRYADEIRNSPNLSLDKAFAKDLFIDYPGFEGHRMGLGGSHVVQDMIKTKITPSLGLVMEDLVDESTAALRDVFHKANSAKEWSSRSLKDDVENIVPRLTARIFLGKELCRNERWLDISKSYAIDSLVLSNNLRTTFAPLQPIAYWFHPEATRLRQAVRDAHAIIDPEVERRKAGVEAARAVGQKPPRVADSLGWMYEMARAAGRPDPDYVAGQLTLAFASINNTVETLTAALLDVCEHPDVADCLREEIVRVIGTGGWTKSSLYDLRLMDSFLREGTRAHPFVTISMQRYVEKPVTLSDGIVLPQGSRLMVISDLMESKSESRKRVPGEFDAERFLRLRQQPGEDKNWQFVTSSPQYMAFGHGSHACPGRYLAAQEIKIALCHLLMKYDWRFVPGEGRPSPVTLEVTSIVPREALVQVRERTPEIDIDSFDPRR